MASLKHWLWLSTLPGLGNQGKLALLRRYGDPEEIYYAGGGELLSTGLLTVDQARSLDNKSMKAAEAVLADCQRLGLRILTLRDGEYPGRLQNIYDPPILLYTKGRMVAFDEEAAVAVVGTRECTPYGIACARKLGHGLAKGGAVVVSGLARGVDAEASHAALRAGGVAVGVVGNGLDIAYPASSRYLYEDIAAGGLLISEYPPGTRPSGGHFPARNRILSGLSVATVVVEAPEKSGALITAEAAAEQGRDVFAVPGPIDAPMSVGCNRLIRDGAGLVSDAWDILREYQDLFPGKIKCEGTAEAPPQEGFDRGEKPAPVPVPPSIGPEGLTEEQLALLRILPQEEGMLADDLAEESGLPIRRVLAALTLLEIGDLASQQPGKRYVRNVTLVE